MAIIISPSFIDVDSRAAYKPLCNIAEVVDGTKLYNKPKGEEPSGFCIANQSRLYIHFNNTDITDTLDKWKTYLQNNNREESISAMPGISRAIMASSKYSASSGVSITIG